MMKRQTRQNPFQKNYPEDLKRWARGAAKLGTKMSLGLTAPLTLIGKKAIDTAADFEYSMSEVGAISGATGGGFGSA